MPESDSIWDRLPGLDPLIPVQKHRARRIEPYETLTAAGAVRPTLKGLADPEPFARELKLRFESWPRWLEPTDLDDNAWDNTHWIDTPVRTLGAVIAALSVCFALILYVDRLVAAVFIAVFAGGVLSAWRNSRRASLTRALKQRSCPDCGYDLRGTPRGIDPSVLGLDIGPRRCPECGARWPLLPPPAPTSPPPSIVPFRTGPEPDRSIQSKP